VLLWTTTSEINFDRFEIQRSTDGRAFETIGSVKGKGFNFKDLETNYSFFDSNPIAGKNYYRLKSVDYDAYFEYSKIILENWEGKRLISVYPNPADGWSIGLTTNFTGRKGSIAEIYNNVGILQQRFRVDDDGVSIFHFSDPLKKGNYFLKFTSSDFSDVVKFSIK
jgi:hypothetical protein